VIEERIQRLKNNLANAERYLAEGKNVKSISLLLYLNDYRGKSGHPAWIRNVMIPRTKARIAAAEKALERIEAKQKDRTQTARRRISDTELNA
jgi:hypothetical protein